MAHPVVHTQLDRYVALMNLAKSVKDEIEKHPISHAQDNEVEPIPFSPTFHIPPK